MCTSGSEGASGHELIYSGHLPAAVHQTQSYSCANLRGITLLHSTVPPAFVCFDSCVCVLWCQVKLDVYLADLTKIGKSQKYSLSVDVEGGKLVVMKKMKDAQEDWNTFTHDKSESVMMMMVLFFNY